MSRGRQLFLVLATVLVLRSARSHALIPFTFLRLCV